MTKPSWMQAAAVSYLVLGLDGDHTIEAPVRHLMDQLVAEVPEAAKVLAFTGQGFAMGSASTGQSADSAPASGAARARTLEARLPAATSHEFSLGTVGSRSQVSFTLEGARAARLAIEGGRGVYRSVYEDVDVIAAGDPAHFELAYVVHEPARVPLLALDVGAPELEVSVSLEPETGAAIVRSEGGRPILRVAPPVAFDAAGVRREGHYELSGSQIAIAINLSDLTPPVLVDPHFTIPFWTLLSDARAPGALAYNAASGSREIRLAFDEARGKLVLIRPVRTQQREDSVFLFGNLAYADPRSARPSPYFRVGPDGSLQSGAAEREDWTRGFHAQSETWEWTGNGWDLTPRTGLPGLIDPALAYDASRQQLVVTSGAYPSFRCRNVPYMFGINSTINCHLDGANATYELGPGGWQTRALSASPPPRVRAAFAQFPPYMVLFGGRALEPPPGNPYVDSYGPPYPDNLAAGLLNDTWRYDGQHWEHLPTANPPPGRESATLVFDERRHRLVLIGGLDTSLDLWEFDGADWVERIRPGDPSLPLSLQQRRKMLAVWNPLRQSTLLFGGIAGKLESCTLTDALIAQRRRDPNQIQALGEAGCLGGYMHDSWEWDGRELRQLTRTAYGGTVRGVPVFRQVEGASSWGTGAPPVPPELAPAATPPLLPWRYDRDPHHFRLRSTLERAHAPSDLPGSRMTIPSTAVALEVPEAEPPSFASPLFASAAQPDMVFDRNRSKALIVSPEDGRVFETDGAVWNERTPEATPFATGAQDFFGATWDTDAQRVVLFDPRTASTWTHSDAGGWQRLQPNESPPHWGVDPDVRRERDRTPLNVHMDPRMDRFTDIAKRAPQMTFDRARSRVVMLYEDRLWEFDGTSWLSFDGPLGWANCPSATLIAYDGLRSRVVAVGCRLPSETAEWDGSTWQIFVGPHSAKLHRSQSYGNITAAWRGSLQLAWSHPNALFESSLLGGVSTFDADGTLSTWDGASWRAGPKLPDGHDCDWTQAAEYSHNGFPLSVSHMFGRHRDFSPLCFFPPAVEDGANGRILAFRDGASGLRELRVSDADASWGKVKLGNVFRDYPAVPYGVATRMHPHPFELASAEHVLLRTYTDPSSIQLFGTTPQPLDIAVQLPRDKALVPESLVNNLFWPFRILADPVTQRIRVLSHRGALWELGAEQRKGPGATCQDTADCLAGFCSPEKICCNSPCSGSCQTCKGTQLGTCESVAPGAADPLSRCGSGECGGVCGPQAQCVYDAARSCGPPGSCANGALTPGGHCSGTAAACVTTGLTPTPCAGGLVCQDESSCKTTCSARTDCSNPYAECGPTGAGCQADAVSVAANARGVQPSDWVPEVRRTPAEVAQLFRQAGFESDDQGRILFTDFAMGGVTLIFDPRVQNPATGFRGCMERVQACYVTRATLDACVAATPRCVSNTPWLDDPGGFDCCPAECLLEYFEQRANQSEGDAFINLSTSLCYPGLETYLQDLQ